jgi:hypothetical protein
LREEHRLRVFENRVLRRIFGHKREEDGSWRELHNDELHSLYSSPNIVRVIKSRSMRWVGHVARMKTYWGSGGIVLRILDLGTRWKREVSFTSRPLYPQGKSLWYPLDRRLRGTQNRSGRGGEEKNSQPPPEPDPRTPIVHPVAQRYTD